MSPGSCANDAKNKYQQNMLPNVSCPTTIMVLYDCELISPERIVRNMIDHVKLIKCDE